MIIAIIILIVFMATVWVFIVENEKNNRLPSLYGWSILLLSCTLTLISFFVDYGEISVKSMIAGIMFIGNVLGLVIMVGYLLFKKKEKFILKYIG